MTTVDLPLLPLGRGRDPLSERGVECPGDLPAASDPELVARCRAAPAGRDGVRRLGGGQRAAEAVRGDQDAHAPP